jgi:hypothetical protein
MAQAEGHFGARIGTQPDSVALLRRVEEIAGTAS